MRVGILLGALLLAVPLLGRTADIPVSYLVDAKAFKKNIPAGTSISFELHSDSGCSSLIIQEDVTAGSADLLVESVRLRKLSGQAKVPRVFRIHAVVSDVQVEDQFFLKVVAGDQSLRNTGRSGRNR